MFFPPFRVICFLGLFIPIPPGIRICMAFQGEKTAETPWRPPYRKLFRKEGVLFYKISNAMSREPAKSVANFRVSPIFAANISFLSTEGENIWPHGCIVAQQRGKKTAKAGL